MPGDAWIQTYTGKRVYPLDPDPETICVEDIAHALASQNRFSGHTLKPYNVAHHSVIVAEHCTAALRLIGLLHDGSEAYLVDVARPLKRLPEFAAYREAERKLQKIVYKALGIEIPEMPMTHSIPVDVAAIDDRVLATEVRDLMFLRPKEWAWMPRPYSMHISPWTPEESEHQFLTLYHRLKDGADE